MPKRIPGYLLHKPSGQARVRLNGTDHYLGPHGSPESRKRFDELIADYLRRKRRPSTSASFDAPQMSIGQLCVAYMKFAKGDYRKNGRPTSEISALRAVLKPLIASHGRERISEFGPALLKDFLQELIASGRVRKSINIGIGRIKRMFRWSVENELVPPDVHAAINAELDMDKVRSIALSVG